MNNALVGRPDGDDYIWDAARWQWTRVAARSITVHPPDKTHPCGFVWPEPEHTEPDELSRFAGGWAKR